MGGQATMTHATTEKIISLQEFLNYDQDTDAGYELEDGRLLLMPTESEINRRIACFLFAYFLQLGVSFSRLTMKTRALVILTLGPLLKHTERYPLEMQANARQP